MTNAILRGKPDAGNPHVRFDEGEVASAKPRRGSLLYKRAWCAAFGLTAALAFSAVGAELVKNGGFDTGGAGQADSWWLPPHFRIEDNGGLNGNRGLAWENADPKMNGEWVDQRIKVRPGVAYRMSCWARCEDIKGMTSAGEKACVTLILTVSDKDGKYICGCYASRISGTKPWTKLEGVTGKMPANAAQIKVTPFVWHRATGRAWFDEVSVEAIESEPIGGFWSSAYRDCAWDGDVSFFASLGIDEAEMPLGQLSVELAYSDGSFGTKRVPFDAFDALEGRVKIAVADLPLGEFPVSVEIWKKNPRKLVDERSLVFTRTDRAPERKCWFDSANRLIVDGKPFFPLGCYDYGAGDRSLAEMKKGPFNCIMPYEMLSPERWNAIQTSGLKLIATMKDFMPQSQYSRLKMETQGDADRALLHRFRQLKDHPALLAWYMNDESSVGHIPRLERQYRLVRERDPDHPVWALLCRRVSIREYSGTCDVIGTDPYPIPDKTVDVAGDFARETARAFFGRPMWQVPQAFAWKWFRKGNAEDQERNRMPTKAEMRSMTWQHIAGGGNGIIFYSLGVLLRNLTDRDAFDSAWKDVCDVAREVKAYEPILLADPVSGVTDCPPGLSVRTWSLFGRTCLLVVNETDRTNRGVIRLSRRFSDVRSQMDEPASSLEDDRLTVELPPMGVTMFTLK